MAGTVLKSECAARVIRRAAIEMIDRNTKSMRSTERDTNGGLYRGRRRRGVAHESFTRRRVRDLGGVLDWAGTRRDLLAEPHCVVSEANSLSALTQ